MAKAHDDSFSKLRTESLTDGIFATVMTILILSLIVSIITGPSLSGKLYGAILSLLPSIMIYVFSFTVLLVMWIGHNNVFRHVHSISPRLMWKNGLFLLLIGIVPLSTALLGRYPLEKPAIFFYGVNFLLLTLVFRLFYRYLNMHHEQSAVIRRTSRNNWLGIITYVCAMAISFISPYISIAFFALMPIFYLYHAFFGMYREIK